MSIEDLEGVQVGGFERLAFSEERPTFSWNGRDVGNAQFDHQINEVRGVVLNQTASKMVDSNPGNVSIAFRTLVFPDQSVGWGQSNLSQVVEREHKAHQNREVTGGYQTLEYSPDNVQAHIILCGEKVDGAVSVSGSADTQGNKSVEAEVQVSSKDGNVSASVSGSVSQDKDGHTEGKVEFKTTTHF